MATNKNITMKQYNGTSYDTVYPTTTIKQVQGLSDELNSNELPVATIMDSVETEPGKMKGTWLPCDGREVNKMRYPDLANILPESVNLNFRSDSIDMNVDVLANETFGGAQYTLGTMFTECVEYYGDTKLFTCYASYNNYGDYLYRIFYILSNSSENRIIDSGILGYGFITHRVMGGVKYILTDKVVDADETLTHEVLFHFDRQTGEAVIDFESGDEGLSDVNWSSSSLSFACIENVVYSYVIGTGNSGYKIVFAGSIPALFMNPSYQKTVGVDFSDTSTSKTLYTVLNNVFLLYARGRAFYIEDIASGEFNMVLNDPTLNEPILPEDMQTSGNYIYFLPGKNGTLYYFDTITHTVTPLTLQSAQSTRSAVPLTPYRFVVSNNANYVACFSSASPDKKLYYSLIHNNEETEKGSYMLEINGEYTQRNSETNGFVVCECIENNPVDRKITIHILESRSGLVAKVVPNITNTDYYSYIKASLN